MVRWLGSLVVQQGLLGVSGVGYAPSGVHMNGSHCSGVRETGTVGANVHSMQRLDIRH